MNKDQVLKLDNQLCFAIYACSREITALYRPLLDRFGITYPQYLALLVLWEDGVSTVKQLGERLYLDSGTLTPMLKRMESLGLVTRQRAQDDERKVMVMLTDKGKALEKEAYCVPETLAAGSGLSKQQFEDLLSQFKQLRDHVHEQNRKR